MVKPQGVIEESGGERVKKAITFGMLMIVIFLIALVLPAVQGELKAGDYIKIEFTVAGAPTGTQLPQWMKLEVLSVTGTTANIRTTMHMTDGTEQTQTVTVDVTVGGQTSGFSGMMIPRNSKTGDSITMSGLGTIAIGGETTRSYAGADRAVVYASVSQQGSQLTYYWDKATGVIMEVSGTSAGMTVTAKVTETNMWQPQLFGGIEPTTLYILIAAVIVIAVGGVTAVFLIRRRKKTLEVVVKPET